MELVPDFGASLPLLPEDDMSYRVGPVGGLQQRCRRGAWISSSRMRTPSDLKTCPCCRRRCEIQTNLLVQVLHLASQYRWPVRRLSSMRFLRQRALMFVWVQAESTEPPSANTDKHLSMEEAAAEPDFGCTIRLCRTSEKQRTVPKVHPRPRFGQSSCHPTRACRQRNQEGDTVGELLVAELTVGRRLSYCRT